MINHATAKLALDQTYEVIIAAIKKHLEDKGTEITVKETVEDDVKYKVKGIKLTEEQRVDFEGGQEETMYGFYLDRETGEPAIWWNQDGYHHLRMVSMSLVPEDLLYILEVVENA